MFSVKPLIVALALGGTAVALTAPEAAKADTVVASSGPSSAKYPVGKTLKDSDTITLRAGDKVTVLSSKGTRVISGAGTHVVGARGGSKRSTFAALTRTRSGARARTGAVRSGTPAGSDQSQSQNLWQVDVSQGGNVCLTDTNAMKLFRPGGEGKATYRVADASTTAHLHVTFEDGVKVTSLDTSRMAITPGQPYTISGPNGGSPVTVTFTMLEGKANGPEALAGDLIANGCTGQLELLSNAMMTT